jgi:hypothetical protein
VSDSSVRHWGDSGTLFGVKQPYVEEANPLDGERLPRRLRLSRADPERYVASAGGPLPYMRRLREIEELIDEHLDRLEQAYGERGAGWRRVAERWNFTEVNDLIERHNRWYPLEARLAMDPRSRDFVRVGGRPYRREPLDGAWVLERFPA